MDTVIELYHGDITRLEVDAVVNAANTWLRGGGGVDGAIHRAAGPLIHEECMKIIELKGRIPTGEAAITRAGNLKAKFIIHAVGPVWYGGNSNEHVLLANAYHNSLLLAREYNIKSVAFPNISTGIYGYPKREAATIAIEAVSNFLRENNEPDKVIFCSFDDENFLIYQELLGEIPG